MAFDYAKALFWTRFALRDDEETLPDETILPLVKSSKRQLLPLYPQVVEIGGADLLLLDEEDFEAVSEAIGWLTAATWIFLPRPDGDELVKKLKIGQLEQVYEVPDLSKLVDFYREKCEAALRSISIIDTAIAERWLAGIGRPRIGSYSPIRHQAKQYPNGAGTLAALFAARQVEFFGYDFGGSAASQGDDFTD